jgi:hypothetical protein
VVLRYFSQASDALTFAIELSAHDELYLAESHYWAGEADYSRLIVDPGQNESLAKDAEQHFRNAAKLAKQNEYDNWAIYQIRLAELLVGRARAAKNRNQQTEFDKYAKQVQQLANEVLDQGGDTLKPLQVSEATNALLNVASLDTELRSDFFDAVDKGLGLLQKFVDSSPRYEADIRLARSEYLLKEAVIKDHALTEGEKETLTGDADFLVAHTSGEDQFENKKRSQLVRPLVTAMTSDTLTTAEMKTTVEKLGLAIEAMHPDILKSGTARVYHAKLVIQLFTEAEALTTAEKKKLADKVDQYLSVYTKQVRSGNGFILVKEFKSLIDDLHRRADAE